MGNPSTVKIGYELLNLAFHVSLFRVETQLTVNIVSSVAACHSSRNDITPVLPEFKGIWPQVCCSKLS
jgi:hypothetical protein